MNSFTKSFLNEDWKAVPDAPRFYLGAFGKHPGWNDHLDDIGIATTSMVEARRLVYGGIASQIESAAWDKAGPEKVGPGFDHVFFWTRMGETLTGLIWSSTDGKGRALYPMILLAHSVAQPSVWVPFNLLPQMERTAEMCRGATTAKAVIREVEGAQEALREKSMDVTMPPFARAGDGVGGWAAHFASDTLGLRRVLHYLLGNLQAFAPGSTQWCADSTKGASAHLRLPRVPGSTPSASLNAWISFVATQIDPAVPILALQPRNGTWVDVIVGEPALTDFFVLRALPSAVPLVTDIPYQLDPAMQNGFSATLSDLARGELPSISAFNGESTDAIREASVRWLSKFRPNDKSGFFSRFLKSS
jgi:hypothetical protein